MNHERQDFSKEGRAELVHRLRELFELAREVDSKILNLMDELTRAQPEHTEEEEKDSPL